MRIKLDDLMYYEFIEELKRQKQIVLKREDLEIKNRISAEIEDEYKHATEMMKGMEVYEQDSVITDFQEFVAEKIIEYYNEISEKFQKSYAIFENQMAKVTKGKLFDFNEYPKVGAMNDAVNVMKHGKGGRSYNSLLDAKSKYLRTPTEFLSLCKDIPTELISKIIEYKYSGTLLNLEYTDLIEFFDEAITAWADHIESIKETKDSSKGV